jgi:hypothetical protein
VFVFFVDDHGAGSPRRVKNVIINYILQFRERMLELDPPKTKPIPPLTPSAASLNPPSKWKDGKVIYIYIDYYSSKMWKE